jgi:hypothetical protein
VIGSILCRLIMAATAELTMRFQFRLIEHNSLSKSTRLGELD